MRRGLLPLILMSLLLAPAALAEDLDLDWIVGAIEKVALGETFVELPSSQYETLVAPLADRYEFVGRTSESGHFRYILGRLREGQSTPDFKEQVNDFDGEDITYSVARSDGTSVALAGLNQKDVAQDGRYLLLKPTDSKGTLRPAFRALFEPDGPKALQDMAARGASMVMPHMLPHARVAFYGPGTYRVEYFLLDYDTVNAFKKEKTLQKGKVDEYGYVWYPRDYGIGYTTGGYDADIGSYTYDQSVPSTLLALAQQKCGYVYVKQMPKEAPVKAVLSWQNDRTKESTSQTVEDAAQLKQLNKLLRGSEASTRGKCPYDAGLVLSYADGTTITVIKSTDACGTLIVGSCGARLLSNKANRQFWKLFPDVWNELTAGMED